MSLWDGAWKHLDRGKGLIAFVDDASRRIMCYGVFDKCNKYNNLKRQLDSEKRL